MELKDIIWTATTAIYKNLYGEDLYSSDYMYGNEELTDKVMEYVDECHKIGYDAFKVKYAEYKFHPGF